MDAQVAGLDIVELSTETGTAVETVAGVYFGVGGPVRSYRDAVRHQREQMLRFIKAAIDHGVYFHDYGGAACHHGFCHAMTLEHADDALSRLGDAVKSIGERGP